LHPKKLRARGFNTAYALAGAVSSTLKLPILEKALVRNLFTPAQAGLDKNARQKNLVGAFSILPENLHGHQRILLIDDVYTTGATLSHCTRLLQEAGVKQVTILTLARALPPDVF
jgi:predicted amidophosphoribosyltransferase